MEYPSREEMADPDRELLAAAEEASGSAYSPYSGFKVGAAVRLANGTVVTGSNQENAAYPDGLCAERVALFSAGSHYPGDAITALAVYARCSRFRLGRPVTPCGSCRQVIAESQNRHKTPIRVIMGGDGGHVIVVESIENLLPLSFHLDELKS